MSEQADTLGPPDRAETRLDLDHSTADAGVKSAPPPRDAVPAFDLVRQIGTGGFGDVWLARERITGVQRAIKFLPKSRPRLAQRDLEGVKRYQHAAQQHPHLVQILTVGEADQYFYYVMEAADHQGRGPSSDYAPTTLRSEMQRRGRLDVGEALQITAKLASAVARLNQDGLAHNDLKPENVLIVRGEPKLADVGLAGGSGEVQNSGTPAYMADGKADDLFALGMMLYEMVCGQPASNYPRGLPPDLALRPTPAARTAVAIFNRTCHPDPAHRFVSAQELHLAAAAALTSAASARKWLLLAGGVVAAGLLAVALYRKLAEPHWIIDIPASADNHERYTRVAVENVAIEPRRIVWGRPYHVSADYLIRGSADHRLIAGLAVKTSDNGVRQLRYLGEVYSGVPPPSGAAGHVRITATAPSDLDRHTLFLVVAHVRGEPELIEAVAKGDADSAAIGVVFAVPPHP